MAAYLNLRNSILLEAYDEDFLDEDEIALLLEIEKRAPIPHRNYARFSLEAISESESIEMLRFNKNDIHRLAEALRIPPKIVGYQRTAASGIEALFMLLRRLAYPCRYFDLIPLFGRSKPEMSVICNEVVDFIHREHGHLVNSFDAPWMSREMLTRYCHAVEQAGAPLNHCWGFVDGTVRILLPQSTIY